jgi:hypothetical protein
MPTLEQLKKMESEWDKRGYYLLNGKKYYSKLQAIVNARDGHHPEFVFNDTEFTNANWLQEPAESLEELYRQRALQLRQKYDHLILCYSSGADSTNILHAFLNNNITLDEIFCYGPFDTTQGQNGDVASNSAEYNYREIDLIALPYLRELSKKHKFKLTYYSWANDVINGYKDADWVWTEVNCRMSPSTIARNRLHNSHDHLDLVDQGKRIGFIYGVDKPRLILRDGVYYLGFLDLLLQLSVGMGGIATGSDWENDEFFYWTPDMPSLVIKQAHMLKQFFENNPALKSYVENADQAEWSQKYSEKYFDVVKKIVYPTFNPNTWQTKKISSLVFSENDSWFFENSDATAKKYWLAGVQEVDRVVDSRWFNQGSIKHGIVGSWSKWYKVG